MLEPNTLAEITVSYRPHQEHLEMPALSNSQKTFDVVRTLFPKDRVRLQEQFIVLYLNKSNKLIGYYRHSIGGISGTVADIRIILGVALKCAATSMILAHNHPSGNLKPSSADIELTRKISEAARLMDVMLLDHIIVSDCEDYFSFSDDRAI